MEDVTVATVAIWHCLEIIGEPQTIVVNIIMFSIKVAICSGSPSLPIHGDSHRCFPRRKIYAIEKLTGAGRSDGCCATSGIWSRKSGFFPGFSMDGSNKVVKFINVFFRFWSPQCAVFTHKNHSGDFDHVWSIFSTYLLGLHMAS